MIDIGDKTEVYREAIAEGEIILSPETIQLIKEEKVEKGNVFNVSEITAILSAKKTPELLPFCHPIPITNVSVEYEVGVNSIRARGRVKSIGRTGVEMEALMATSTALLNIWDMVKKYEKDDDGQYPVTQVKNIRVLSKIKREMTTG
ncbi:MAG: cyclic pyranopterin monophosphate synthase MoaC [Promethearchaeota archaeon]